MSLPIDGSRDNELNFKGFPAGDLVIGDWTQGAKATVFEEVVEHTKSEYSPIPSTFDDSPMVEYVEGGALHFFH